MSLLLNYGLEIIFYVLDAQAASEVTLCSNEIIELALEKKQMKHVFIFTLPQLEDKFLPSPIFDRRMFALCDFRVRGAQGVLTQ